MDALRRPPHELASSPLGGGRRRSSLASGGDLSPTGGGTGGLLRRTSLRRAATPMVKVHGGSDANGGALSPVVKAVASRCGRSGEAGGTASASSSAGVRRRGDLWQVEGDEAPPRYQLHLSVSCDALSVSVVDGAPKELLYATLGGLSLTASEGPAEEERSVAALPPSPGGGRGAGGASGTGTATGTGGASHAPPRIEHLELRT